MSQNCASTLSEGGEGIDNARTDESGRSVKVSGEVEETRGSFKVAQSVPFVKNAVGRIDGVALGGSQGSCAVRHQRPNVPMLADFEEGAVPSVKHKTLRKSEREGERERDREREEGKRKRSESGFASPFATLRQNLGSKGRSRPAWS